MEMLPELLQATNNFGNTRSGSLVGPFGGFLIVSLLVVTVLLIRNMNARLRRLPERFPAPDSSPIERGGSKADSQSGSTEPTGGNATSQ